MSIHAGPALLAPFSGATRPRLDKKIFYMRKAVAVFPAHLYKLDRLANCARAYIGAHRCAISANVLSSSAPLLHAIHSHGSGRAYRLHPEPTQARPIGFLKTFPRPEPNKKAFPCTSLQLSNLILTLSSFMVSLLLVAYSDKRTGVVNSLLISSQQNSRQQFCLTAPVVQNCTLTRAGDCFYQ